MILSLIQFLNFTGESRSSIEDDLHMHDNQLKGNKPIKIRVFLLFNDCISSILFGE